MLTYHNGPKVVGICRGSGSMRVLAQELTETREGTSHYRETLYRIVEFGVAYDHGSLVSFLEGASVLETSASGYLATDTRPDIPGLEG